MNPEAPVTVNSENFGTERDVANCPFFLKTGACRFGDRYWWVLVSSDLLIIIIIIIIIHFFLGVFQNTQGHLTQKS